MTIPYPDKFWRCLMQWSGSLYKCMWRELLAYYVLYYALLLATIYGMSDAQKVTMSRLVINFELGKTYIPLYFLVGFFVIYITGRWWIQCNLIAWPDKLMMLVASYLRGDGHQLIRRTVARWANLQAAICWREVSVRTRKRFPTERHLVTSGLMKEQELALFSRVQKRGPHEGWFLPTLWTMNLMRSCFDRQEIDRYELKRLMHSLMEYRDQFMQLYKFEWVQIPLIYTQVVTIMVYVYFFVLSVVAGQPKLDIASKKTEVPIYVPIFTTLQMLFYLGWMKAGQRMMDPFGEDEDDFEVNFILDRNVAVSYSLIDDMNQLPGGGKPSFAGRWPISHTRASMRIREQAYKGELAKLSFDEQEQAAVKFDVVRNDLVQASVDRWMRAYFSAAESHKMSAANQIVVAGETD